MHPNRGRLAERNVFVKILRLGYGRQENGPPSGL
jgi:hypothetical protein